MSDFGSSGALLRRTWRFWRALTCCFVALCFWPPIRDFRGSWALGICYGSHRSRFIRHPRTLIVQNLRSVGACYFSLDFLLFFRRSV